MRSVTIGVVGWPLRGRRRQSWKRTFLDESLCHLRTVSTPAVVPLNVTEALEEARASLGLRLVGLRDWKISDPGRASRIRISAFVSKFVPEAFRTQRQRIFPIDHWERPRASLPSPSLFGGWSSSVVELLLLHKEIHRGVLLLSGIGLAGPPTMGSEE